MKTQTEIDAILALPLNERLPKLAEMVTEHGATAELVGKWVWAKFAEKPITGVREELKKFRFRWNRVRGLWQYAGVPRRRSNASNDTLRAFYGARQVTTAPAQTFERVERAPSLVVVREVIHSGEEI